MSCNKCNKKLEDCGCGSNGIHVSPPSECNTPTCPDPEPCSGSIPTTCIQHVGEDKICGAGTVYQQGDSIEEVNSKIVDYFCGKSIDSINYIEVTYEEIDILIQTNSLNPGSLYNIIDFQTIYDQPDFDVSGNPKVSVVTKTGPIEPLIVLALSVNVLALECFQPLHPLDLLKYDVHFGQTEIMGSPAKGRITERIDEAGNRADYDHKNVYFLRYESVASSGVFDSYKDTGNASAELNTFGYLVDSSCINNIIGDYARYRVSFSLPFLLPNNVIGDSSRNNKIGHVSDNNTLINQATDNTIGNFFSGNITFATFARNKFGNGATDNIFNNLVGNNVIENNFSDNVVEIFGNNFVGDSCVGNVFTDNFSSNQVSSFFQNNVLGICTDNVIGNNFSDNNITSVLANNTISIGFSLNTITADLEGNIFQGALSNCIIPVPFFDNILEPSSISFSGIDFTGATHVSNNYNCRIFRNSLGVERLLYYDGTDTQTIVNPTA